MGAKQASLQRPFHDGCQWVLVAMATARDLGTIIMGLFAILGRVDKGPGLTAREQECGGREDLAFTAVLYWDTLPLLCSLP